MSAIDLTRSQQAILCALVDLYQAKETKAVKGRMIGETIGRNPGSIRNQMQSLKDLRLVEGIAGPEGGYRPTELAWAVLGLSSREPDEEIPVFQNGERVPRVSVEDVVFPAVHHPDLCRAELRVRGSLRQFHPNHTIRTGPTPLAGLVIVGTIVDVDEPDGILIADIDRLLTSG